jgi:hypothetical protein
MVLSLYYFECCLLALKQYVALPDHFHHEIHQTQYLLLPLQCLQPVRGKNFSDAVGGLRTAVKLETQIGILSGWN